MINGRQSSVAMSFTGMVTTHNEEGFFFLSLLF
jgi:hypothetical protein